jgi:hypothetical protein
MNPRDLRLEGLVTQLAAAGLPVDLVVDRSMGRSARPARSAGHRSTRHPSADHRAVAVALMIGDESGD